MRRRASIVATLVLVVAVACSGSSDDERVAGSAAQSTESGDVATSETPTTTETTSTNTASAAIAEFDDAPTALARSLGAINESALADPDALRAEALVGLGAGEPNHRFASVLALTMTASTADPASIEALRTLSSSPDVTERLLAAGALAALGEKNGVDVLIDALVSEELLRNLDPPFAAWRYSRANLLLFIDQDLGLADARDAAATAAAQPAWMDWWAANAAELTWNAELGRYEAPA
jgi:HEAT repeat protein